MVSMVEADPPATIRVLIADSRRFFSAGLTRLLSDRSRIDIVGDVTSLPSFLDTIGEDAPHVALVSHGLADDELVLLDAIRAITPGTAVVVYGMPPAPGVVIETMRAGAKGLVDQEAGLDDLMAVIEGVAAGRIVVSPRLAAQMGASDGDGSLRRGGATAGHALSSRESDVLCLVAEGASNRQAAATLGLSEHTVRAHLRAAMRKLNVETRVQAVARGVLLGLVPAAAAERRG